MSLLIPERVKARAATRYVVDENDCWVSSYSTSTHGYAQLGWQDGPPGSHKMTLAHRSAFEYHTGERIPDGMTIDHMCRNRRCVNPDHLRMLSMTDNSMRNADGRDFPVGWSCVKNHDSSLRRTRTRKKKNGHTSEVTFCLQCDRDSNARYRAKVRAK